MSNIKDIQVLNEKAIAVLLPECAVIAGIYKNELLFTNKAKDDPYPVSLDDVDGIDLPPGSWSILGMSDKLTEDDWKKVVETVDYDVQPSPGNDFQGDWRTAWRDYDSMEETGCSEFPFVHTALLSGQSLLKSKGIEVPHLILVKNG